MSTPTHRIMVVDDDETVLRVVGAVLEDAGFEVLLRSGALGTSVEIARATPHVLVLDVDMPALSGDRLAEVLSEHPITREVKLVLYSSLPDQELDALRRRLGAAAAVSKRDGPVALKEAVLRVTRALGTSTC